MPSEDAARPLPPEPTTPDELHAWLKDALKLTIPRAPVLEGSSAPFDYLCFAFFGPGLWVPRRSAAALPSIAGAQDLQSTATVPPRSGGVPTDCVVWANRGGGKTFLGAVATLLDLLFRPTIEVRILAGSLEQSKRMHAHLRRLFDPRTSEALAAEVDGKITERRLALKNGSSVELLAQSQTSVRGTRVQKLRCDEVDLFDPEVWDAAQLTTRSKQCGDHLVRGSVECLSTMHIPHGVMHRLVQEAREGKRSLFRWGVVDVLARCGEEHVCRATEMSSSRCGATPDHREDPRTGHLGGTCPLLPECQSRAKDPARTPGHVTVDDAIAQKRRVPLVVWESEMLCLRPRRTHAVLPEFDPHLHVFDHAGPAPHLTREWAVGMDFGFTAPTAIVYAAIAHDGSIWVMDERVQAKVILGEHIRAISQGLAREGIPAWPPPAFIAPDPAGFQQNQETGNAPIPILHQHGYTTRISRAMVNEGLNLVRARLAPATGERPRLFVHKRCTTLIECLEKYHFDPKRPEDPNPVKDGHDHAVDALRYLVQALDRPSKTQRGNYADG
ncbi:MAG TPA: hypothetical protein VD997_16440 [Phycisphaerales bacterium]|nr:hypothetical protein [Phycisphaerales bacterium]